MMLLQLVLDGECDYGVCLDMIVVGVLDANMQVLIVLVCDIEIEHHLQI